MGRFSPVFAAFIILVTGFHIFRAPDGNERYKGLLIPGTIFTFSTFLLLCEMSIYPKSMRTMGGMCQTMAEYFIASYLMENLLIDFWLPVELQVLLLIEKLSINVEVLLHKYGVGHGPLCDFLGNINLQIAVCSLVSSFFLLAVLQATRAINLDQIFTHGCGFFFKDTVFRLKLYFKNHVFASLKESSHKKRSRYSSKSSRHGRRKRKSSKSRSRQPECEIYPDDFDLKETFSDFEMGLSEELSE